MAYTEDHLIEQPAIHLMEHGLAWNSVNAYDEWISGTSSLGREAKREVVLTGRLKPALQSLNPKLPAEALDAAVEELTRDFFFLGAEPGGGEPGDRQVAARRGEGEDPGSRTRRSAMSISRFGRFHVFVNPRCFVKSPLVLPPPLISPNGERALLSENQLANFTQITTFTEC